MDLFRLRLRSVRLISQRVDVDMYFSGGSKSFEREGETMLPAPSSFIANAHTEIYGFYTEKAAF